MAKHLVSSVAEPRRNPALYLLGVLVYCAVAVREVTFRADEGNRLLSVALLAAVLLLFATDPFLFRRLPWYRYPYFALQTVLIFTLGLLPPYQDIWGMLYILVAVQARYYLPVPSAIAWGGLSAPLLTVTLMFTMGWAYGLGLGLGYIAGAVLVVSWDLFSSRAETANRESHALLIDLQQAHQRLQAYADKVEEQAAARERDRLAHQIHDSVGQTIFGITLTAEAARLLLDKDPARVPAELERLQDLTSSALSQMRSLIAQWRPK